MKKIVKKTSLDQSITQDVDQGGPYVQPALKSLMGQSNELIKTPLVTDIEVAGFAPESVHLNSSKFSKADFFTWTESPDGLMAAVGTVTSRTIPINVAVSMVIASINVAAKSIFELDPMQIMYSLNDFLIEYMPYESPEVSLTVAVWDEEIETLFVSSAGQNVVLCSNQDSVVSYEAEDQPLGISCGLHGVPLAFELDFEDTILVSSADVELSTLAGYYGQQLRGIEDKSKLSIQELLGQTISDTPYPGPALALQRVITL